MKLRKNSFHRKERLVTSSDFKQIKRKNHLFFNQGPVKVYILGQNSEYSRLGIIVYKSSGKAYFRNKIKRWLREIFRVNKNAFGKKIDILFAVGRGADIVDFDYLKEVFFKALEKRNAAKGPQPNRATAPVNKKLS